jgi:hypothetical protein
MNLAGSQLILLLRSKIFFGRGYKHFAPPEQDPFFGRGYKHFAPPERSAFRSARGRLIRSAGTKRISLRTREADSLCRDEAHFARLGEADFTPGRSGFHSAGAKRISVCRDEAISLRRSEMFIASKNKSGAAPEEPNVLSLKLREQRYRSSGASLILAGSCYKHFAPKGSKAIQRSNGWV